MFIRFQIDQTDVRNENTVFFSIQDLAVLFDSVLCERLQGCRASLSTLQNHHPCAQTHVACSETKKIWKKKCLKWQHYQDLYWESGDGCNSFAFTSVSQR